MCRSADALKVAENVHKKGDIGGLAHPKVKEKSPFLGEDRAAALW
jgi:hypothetical protein